MPPLECGGIPLMSGKHLSVNKMKIKGHFILSDDFDSSD